MPKHSALVSPFSTQARFVRPPVTAFMRRLERSTLRALLGQVAQTGWRAVMHSVAKG